MTNYQLAPDYARFMDYVRENIEDYIEGITDCDVELMPVVKNNQVVMDALKIQLPKCRQAPMIYLNTFYEEYRMGMDLTEVMENIAVVFNESLGMQELIDPEAIRRLDMMRDRIVMRVVNGVKNAVMLSCCPHRFVADLAVTYRILAGKSQGGVSTILVTDDMARDWGMSESELYLLACMNSMRIFPPVVMPMREMLKEEYHILLEEEFPQLQGIPCNNELYVLTNDCRINGASAMCYSNALAWFGKKMKSDFYILPSSIHEVLLLSAKSDLTPEHLANIVREANTKVVQKEDVLSDFVYYYSCSRRKFEKYSGQIQRNLLQ